MGYPGVRLRVPVGGQSRFDWLPVSPPFRSKTPGPLAHGRPGLLSPLRISGCALLANVLERSQHSI